MIKELRKELELTTGQLSFVLGVDEKQIEDWEKSGNVPPEIVKILQKRFGDYFSKNDQGLSVLKKKENKDNNGTSKLDQLLQNQNKRHRKSKKIVLKKKKDTNTEKKPLNGKTKNINVKKINPTKTVTVKDNTDKEKSKEKLNGVNLPTDYLKSLIDNNNATKTSEFSSLRDIRKYLKKSQTELGDALEINQRKISIWEITNAKLPKEVIEKISEKFYIPFEDIKHLIESDESSYLLDNLPITKDSMFYDKESDSINIHTLRKTFGHSLRSFANEIGVHYQTVARWEKGNGTPKDYILKGIIDKFFNRKAVKTLIDKGIDIGLKEEYAHWEKDLTEEEKIDLEKDIPDETVKKIIDKKLETMSLLEETGIEVDSVMINSKKSITIFNDEQDFRATLILNDDVLNELKILFVE